MLDFYRKKVRGSVYTPRFLVLEMLDFVGYSGTKILSKHVMDNSCGDGAFLREVVRIYCSEFQKRSDDVFQLKKELEEFIHGIEVEAVAAERCRQNLDEEALKFGVLGVIWDIRCADALLVDDFNGRMDYIVGNPPYVRIHNLKNVYSAVRKFSFGRTGMTDLFIVFFEVGFRMLSTRGKMVLVTPSSWLSSSAAGVLRNHIIRERNLSGVIDLEHFQAFSATTYSLISLFEQGNVARNVAYFSFDPEVKRRKFRENLPYEIFRFNSGFYFSDSKSLQKIRLIQNEVFESTITVKNGFATLADSVFIGNFNFHEGTIDVVKASTGEWKKCIFPYDKCGNALPLEQFAQKQEAFAVLSRNKDRLLNERDVKEKSEWYLFGRTQALRDVCKNKIAVNNIIRDVDSLKLNSVRSGQGVYGGLYILTDLDVSVIERILRTEEFFDYVKLLKNYKSGGYYAFSSKDLSLFLNFKLKDSNHGQSRISQRYFSFV